MGMTLVKDMFGWSIAVNTNSVNFFNLEYEISNRWQNWTDVRIRDLQEAKLSKIRNKDLSDVAIKKFKEIIKG